MTVEAPDEKGAMQRWGVEWGGAGQLGGQGVTRETFKSGDHVVSGKFEIRISQLPMTTDHFSFKPGKGAPRFT